MSSITLSLVITAIVVSSSVQLRYIDTPGVVIFTNDIFYSLHQESSKLRIDWYQNDKRKIYQCFKLLVRCKEYSCIRHIQCLHLMYAEVAWVVVSSRTQVQPQIIFDPDYLPDYPSVFYDYKMVEFTEMQLTCNKCLVWQLTSVFQLPQR